MNALVERARKETNTRQHQSSAAKHRYYQTQLLLQLCDKIIVLEEKLTLLQQSQGK